MCVVMQLHVCSCLFKQVCEAVYFGNERITVIVVWIFGVHQFCMCTMWEPDKSFYIRECACVGVGVYLSGITHSFQTCLSSTLLCVQKCVHVCTSDCEIPLSVFKASLAQCPLKERERGRPHTHRRKHTPVFCAHLCLHVHRHMHLCVCVCMRANLPTGFFFLGL